MRGNLWDDPRVASICDRTGQGEAAVIGALYWLWATADQHTEDGILPGLTPRSIDRKTGVQGFAQALCDIGWLESSEEGVRIARFEEHNGSSAKRRATDAQRKANVRSVSADDADKDRTGDGQKAPDRGAREREEKSRDGEAAASPGRAGRTCPESFMPSEPEAWIAENCPGLNWQLETAKFRDHEFAAPKKAWQKAWNNWMRRAFQDLRKPINGSHVVNRQEALEARNRAVGEAWLREQG